MDAALMSMIGNCRSNRLRCHRVPLRITALLQWIQINSKLQSMIQCSNVPLPSLQVMLAKFWTTQRTTTSPKWRTIWLFRRQKVPLLGMQLSITMLWVSWCIATFHSFPCKCCCSSCSFPARRNTGNAANIMSVTISERERETWTAHGNTIDSIDSSTDVARKWRSTRKLGGGRAGCGFHGCLHSSSLVAAARPVAMLSLLEIGVMVLHADAMMFFGFEESWRFFRKRFCNACVSCMCIKIVHWPARRLRLSKNRTSFYAHPVAPCCIVLRPHHPVAPCDWVTLGNRCFPKIFAFFAAWDKLRLSFANFFPVWTAMLVAPMPAAPRTWLGQGTGDREVSQDMSRLFPFHGRESEDVRSHQQHHQLSVRRLEGQDHSLTSTSSLLEVSISFPFSISCCWLNFA